MQCQDNKYKYAGFGVRLSAYILDMLIISFPISFIGIIMWICMGLNKESIFGVNVLFNITVSSVIIYGIELMYFVYMTYMYGYTFGKKVFCIKVISSENETLDFWSVLYRESIGKFLSKTIFFLGYFMIIADKMKRGAHDFISDTRVIYDIEDFQTTITIKNETENDERLMGYEMEK